MHFQSGYIHHLIGQNPIGFLLWNMAVSCSNSRHHLRWHVLEDKKNEEALVVKPVSTDATTLRCHLDAQHPDCFVSLELM